MIAAVTTSGLGPHDSHEYALEASGVCRYVGASETGKSTLLEALCFLLWGTTSQGGPFPVEAIRAGAKRIEVVGTTARGTKMGRSLTPGRTWRRWIGEAEYSTEEDFRAALKDIARTEEIEGKPVLVGRLVLAPLAWQSLAQASGGRPLRDLISKLGGNLRDVVKQIFPELRAEDPILMKNATPLRAEAKKQRDTAEGALNQARAGLFALGTAPSTVDVGDAQKVIDLERTWLDVDAALGRVDAHQKYIERLGAEPPKVTAKAQTEAKKAYEAARRDYAGPYTEAEAAKKTLAQAQASVTEADRALSDFDAASGDECPTCHRAGWTAKGENRQGLVELRQMMVDAAAEAEAAATKADAARLAAEQAGVATKAQVDAVTKAAETRSAWERQREALGEAPAAPAKPETERPTKEALATAKKQIDDAKAAEGAKREHARLLQAAKDAVAKAETRHAEAAKLADHYERLIEAVREAPSKLFAAGVAKFGELGPVKIMASEDGAEVLIDGRPWWCLQSRGRMISADAWLRAGLRRAFGMTWFPIVVDDAQSWTGAWPDLAPAIFLETVKGKALERAA